MASKARLPPKWVVTLLGRMAGMEYAIIGPGGQFGSCWTVCIWHPMGPFESSYVPIGRGATVYAAMEDAFPVLRNKDWHSHPVWKPDNWRKRKYVG